ncbi:hypothetical protein ACQ7A3_27555, partial [Klebsiella pneumoniae]
LLLVWFGGVVVVWCWVSLFLLVGVLVVGVVWFFVVLCFFWVLCGLGVCVWVLLVVGVLVGVFFGFGWLGWWVVVFLLVLGFLVGGCWFVVVVLCVGLVCFVGGGCGFGVGVFWLFVGGCWVCFWFFGGVCVG